MENTQPVNQSGTPEIDPDGPSEATFHDADVAEMYLLGQVSRAEADVYDIIADFNDHGSSGQLAAK